MTPEEYIEIDMTHLVVNTGEPGPPGPPGESITPSGLRANSLDNLSTLSQIDLAKKDPYDYVTRLYSLTTCLTHYMDLDSPGSFQLRNPIAKSGLRFVAQNTADHDWLYKTLRKIVFLIRKSELKGTPVLSEE